MMNKYDDDLRKLRDDFVRFKREVTDTLENLDESNFSGNMKKLIARLGGASAGFEAYADAKQAVARMFAEYKTEINKSIASVEAIADANGASITQLVTWQGNVDTSINDLQIRDSTFAESISKIEQTANGNGATIASLVEWKGDAQKSAASIEQAADANGAFIKMLVSAGGTDKNPEDITETEIAGIYISAMNDNSTKIKLNADVIKFGDYAGVDDAGNFFAKRLFGSSNDNGYIVESSDGKKSYYPDFFYAEISSEYKELNGYGADFLIKSIVAHGEELFQGDTVMYGFLFGENLDSEGKSQGLSINFAVGELYDDDNADANATPLDSLGDRKRMLWGYNYKEKVLYPKEVWDFSSCVVKNLGVVPVFG